MIIEATIENLGKLGAITPFNEAKFNEECNVCDPENEQMLTKNVVMSIVTSLIFKPKELKREEDGPGEKKGPPPKLTLDEEIEIAEAK